MRPSDTVARIDILPQVVGVCQFLELIRPGIPILWRRVGDGPFSVFEGRMCLGARVAEMQLRLLIVRHYVYSVQLCRFVYSCCVMLNSALEALMFTCAILDDPCLHVTTGTCPTTIISANRYNPPQSRLTTTSLGKLKK